MLGRGLIILILGGLSVLFVGISYLLNFLWSFFSIIASAVQPFGVVLLCNEVNESVQLHHTELAIFTGELVLYTVSNWHYYYFHPNHL